MAPRTYCGMIKPNWYKDVERALGEEGVHCFALDGRIRMVTHYHVTP